MLKYKFLGGKRNTSSNSKNYEDINVIVAHIGGGASVGAHKKGKIVDVNNALDGAFSPERSGGVQAGDLARMCFSGKYTLEEVLKKITGKGGFVAPIVVYPGEDEMLALSQRAIRVLNG